MASRTCRSPCALNGGGPSATTGRGFVRRAVNGMAQFGSQIAPDVLAICQAGSGDAAAAFGRALGEPFELEASPAGPLDLDALPGGFDGPGLLMIYRVGEAAALVLLPESTGLLPDWFADPDSTGTGRLTTLSQELGPLILPDSFPPDSYQAERVADLGEELRQRGVAAGAGAISLNLSNGQRQGAALLVWPATTAEDVPEHATVNGSAEHACPTGGSPIWSALKTGRASQLNHLAEAAESLPKYMQSLLKIEIPVSVELASKKEPVSRILELSPGSIIQFKKSCDQMLDLAAGNQQIAVGEAVKVGDRFGLRITSIVMPDERFRAITEAGGCQDAASR